MRIILTLLMLSLTLFMTACSDAVDGNLQGAPSQQGTLSATFEAEFDPANKVIPFPTNLLFKDTQDGTLNIPLSGNASSDGPRIAMNALDGFSTVAPITTSFAKAIDPSPDSVNGATVRLWDISDATTKPVTKLKFGIDYFATVSSTDATGRTLAILPLKPLNSSSTYLVILTNGLKSSDGENASPSQTYLSARITTAVFDADTGTSLFPVFTDEQAKALEPLRELTNAQDAIMNAFEVGLSDKAVLAWTFNTQSVGKVLEKVREATVPVAGLPSKISINITPIAPNPLGKADLYKGTITLPYYLSAFSATAPTAPLTEHWEGTGRTHLTRFNPTPIKTTDVTIPLLLAIPNVTTRPISGLWPIAIFQHGITGNRTNMLGLADALAGVGIAAVAIDLPLHGLGSASVPFYVAPDLSDPANLIGERTFDVNYVTQDPTTGSITSSVPDSTVDSSGRHFINLTSLLTTRDNIRQAVADLMGLAAEIPRMDYDNGGPDFDSTKIYFIGHSLGGIVGSVFLANDDPVAPKVKQSVLAFPGGGIAKLLDGSVNIGPEITAGLAAAAGLIKGTSEYEAFFGAAQTILDAADPINYAKATVLNRGLLMLEVVGDSTGNLPDQVVPNHVGTLAKGFEDAPTGTVPAPLSGTDPLATEMGLVKVSGSDAALGIIVETKPLLRFTAGYHGSILDPTVHPLANSTATEVMQKATVGFLAGGGLDFDITTIIPSVDTVLE